MTGAHPGPKHIVWPQNKGSLGGSWDVDAQPGGGRSFLAYHHIFLGYEPLTTPRITTDSEGVLYPIASDEQPRLAIAWSATPDYKTWEFTLRQGVRSLAGNEFTADDVKWAWERVYALKGVGLWRSRRVAGLDTPEHIEVLDRHRIRFSLPVANPEFPQFFAFATNCIFDSVEARKHGDANDPWARDWLADNVAGYGPFTLKTRDSDSMVLTARDDFWLGRPGVEVVTEVGVTHREAGLRLMDKGDANLLTGLFPEELARYAGRPEFNTYRMKANHSTLEFNWLEAPFDDPKLRQAVAYAMPFEQIFDRVYGGYAKPAHSHLTTVAKYYTPNYWRFNTNLETARNLVKESGYPDGLDTELYLLPTAESVRFGEIARNALKQIGINVSLRFVSGMKFGTKVPMWFLEECSHAINEAMYDLAHEFQQPAGMNNGRSLTDPRWTARIKQIRTAPAADQPRLYDEIQRDLLEFMPSVPIAEIETGWIARSDIDPWMVSTDNLSVTSTVWSGHRNILPFL